MSTRWSAILQNKSLSPLSTPLLICITLPMSLFNTSSLEIAGGLLEGYNKNKFDTKRDSWAQHFMPPWVFTWKTCKFWWQIFTVFWLGWGEIGKTWKMEIRVYLEKSRKVSETQGKWSKGILNQENWGRVFRHLS